MRSVIIPLNHVAKRVSRIDPAMSSTISRPLPRSQDTASGSGTAVGIMGPIISPSGTDNIQHSNRSAITRGCAVLTVFTR